MHAIVAEANTVTRVMLRNTLERMGVQVDEARDELGAASLMARSAAPDLALLDFITLRVAFSDVCHALHQLRPDVYIVALMPTDRIHEVTAALDAGADDFMLESSSLQVVEGRLRVIADALEARRGRPRSPVPSVPPEADDAAPFYDVAYDVAEAAPPAPSEPEKADDPVSHADQPAHLSSVTQDPHPTAEPKGYGLYDSLDFPGALGQALSELGLAPAKPIDVVDAAPEPAYTAWSLVVARRSQEAFWCALRVDIDHAPSEALYRTIMQHAARSEEEHLKLLHQLLDLTQAALREAGRASNIFQVYVPYAPVARPTAQLPMMLTSTQAERHRFGLALSEDIRLRLTVTTNMSYARDQTLMQLRPYDVLAAPLYTTDQIMLLRDGTLLNESYIDKIQSLAVSRGLQDSIRVFPPPGSIAVFLRRL